MRLFFTLLIISMIQGILFSQRDSLDYTKSTIFLKDGTNLRVQILDNAEDGNVAIRLDGGYETTISKSEISKIKSDRDYYNFYRNSRTSQRKGFYHGVNVQLMLAKGFGKGADSYETGVGLHYSLGYQFNKNLSTGLGSGIASYEKLFADFFGQVRYSLPLGISSPILGIDVGYGLPLNSLISSDSRIKGGVSFRPNIGLKIATKHRYDLLLDIGVQFQKTTRTQYYRNGSWSEFRTFYRRGYIRLGWVF